MGDLGKLQGETYLSRKDARWIVQTFRELVPQVRNLGGKLFGGKVQLSRPESDGVFVGEDAEPDFAVNAFFPVGSYSASVSGLEAQRLGVFLQAAGGDGFREPGRVQAVWRHAGPGR